MADDVATREQGDTFLPKFDSAGLLTAVVQDVDSGAILMVAHVNQDALDHTRDTGEAHFFSRSRGRLWRKGESSGNVLKIVRILVDCDQDAIVMQVRPAGPACHTGAVSCFYREWRDDGLTRIDR